MTRRRALDWVLIVALTGSWALLVAQAIDQGLRTQRGVIAFRVSTGSAGSYPEVLSPYEDEFLPGDRLLAVDGQDLLDRSALWFFDRATRVARERGSVDVVAERAGTRFEARVELAPQPLWWMIFPPYAALMGVCAFLLVRAPDWHLARRLLVAAWFWAAARAIFDWHNGARSTTGEVILSQLLLSCGVGLTIANAQEFTRSAQPARIRDRAIAVGGAVTGTGGTLFRSFLPGTLASQTATIMAGNAFAVVATLAGLTRAYRRSDPLERRQIRWVVLGFYFAFTLGYISIASGALGLAAAGQFVSVLADAAIPAGILVSVIGYRWLDIDPLISAVGSYTIVGLSVAGIAFALVPRIANATAPALGLDPATAQWLLTMALVVAAIPAHLYLHPRLDRRMFAERYAEMSGFAQLLDEIGHCSGPEELWQLTSERIDELLEPRSLVVYAQEGERFAPRFARGRDGSPSYEADSVLVGALERRGRSLAADSAELDPFDRATLDTLGVALIVPIRAGERLIAFACLGSKRSGDIYTPEEKARLSAVAARCAELLAGAGESQPAPAQVFRREGDLWTIASRGKEIHLRDMRGLHYLATLLREPGREFAVLDLVRTASGLAPVEGSRPDPEIRFVRRLGDAGPVLDVQARSEYRSRLVELEAELADAERCADLGRLERASAEREALLAELESSGRGARPGSDVERARIAVTKVIRTALEKIGEAHPELGAHLAGSIRRGLTCAYEPDPRELAKWEV